MKRNYPSSTGIAVRLRWQRAEEKSIQAKANFEKMIDETTARKAYLQERNVIMELGMGSSFTTGSVIATPAEIDNTGKPIEKRIGHFIDNGNGTVTDTRSGLTWMRCAIGQTWDGRTCQGVEQEYSYHEANTLHHSFAGHDDWRLPTRDELRLIVDPRAFPRTTTSWFWSSSPLDNDPSHAWIVNFGNGYVSISNLGNNKSVRLVRDGQNVGLLDQKSTAHHVTSVAAAEIASKQKKTEEEEQDINRPDTILNHSEAKQILDSEKAAMRERVDQVNAEIERILATEKATTSTAGAAEKSVSEVALKQKTTEDIEQIDNLFDVVLAPVETQWIVDSENLGRSERIAHEDAEIAQVLATQKTAVEVVAEQQAVEEEKRIDELGVQDIAVPATITDVPKKQNAKCAYCGTWGLHSILRITYYTIDFHCFACGKNFFIFNSDTNAVTPTPTVTKPEITQMLKHYDFVLANEVGPLKNGDQWFDEKTQKRRVRTGSPKAFEWLLPFMPLEVIKISKNLSVLERGPGFSHVIAKELRVLIRERKKDKEPYEDLLRGLYGVCTLIDFTRSFSFDIFVVNSIIANVDIRELFNIQIDYSKMGYCYNEALLKTDVKWLIEFFGEPDTHQSFDALWPKIRKNAISRYCWVRLTNENKTTRSLSPKNPQKNMYEWLKAQIERMGYYHSGVYNNSYYLEREKQLQEIATRQDRNHKEWLEQKAARETQLAASPVTVKTTTFVKQRGYAIPAPPKPSHSFSLDMVSIEAKLAETVAVSAILKDIFSEDAPMSPQTAAPEPTTIEASIAGLDVESFLFMQVLASKHIWARDELEKLADHHSLMLDGTLDSINDASYDHFGGPFFEGDDPIEINTEFAKEITA